MAKQTVSAIICALDEAPRIGGVIPILLQCGLFDKVLVVDDGSTDGTARVASSLGAAVVSHAENMGKARAMRTGLEATSAPVVCFIDADLLHLTREHLCALVEPVVSGETPVALAVFKGGRLTTTLAQQISPMISGQRCMLRSLLDDFTGWDSGFGIETEISAHLQRKGIEQKVVEWEGAAQVMKEEKRGPVRGFAARVQMYFDIAKSWLRNQVR